MPRQPYDDYETTLAAHPINLSLHRTGVLFVAGLSGIAGGAIAMTAYPYAPDSLYVASFALSAIAPPVLDWMVGFRERQVRLKISLLEVKRTGARQRHALRQQRDLEAKRALRQLEIDAEHERMALRNRAQELHLATVQAMNERAKLHIQQAMYAASSDQALASAATRLHNTELAQRIDSLRRQWERILGATYHSENRKKVREQTWNGGQPFAQGAIGRVQFAWLVEHEFIVFKGQSKHPQWNAAVAGADENEAMQRLTAAGFFVDVGVAETTT